MTFIPSFAISIEHLTIRQHPYVYFCFAKSTVVDWFSLESALAFHFDMPYEVNAAETNGIWCSIIIKNISTAVDNNKQLHHAIDSTSQLDSFYVYLL